MTAGVVAKSGCQLKRVLNTVHDSELKHLARDLISTSKACENQLASLFSYAICEQPDALLWRAVHSIQEQQNQTAISKMAITRAHASLPCPCLSKISTSDFVVTDSAGEMLAYVYFEVELGGDQRPGHSRKVSCLIVH